MGCASWLKVRATSPIKARNFAGALELLSPGGDAWAFPQGDMLTLLNGLAIVALIAISLAGFAAAVTLTVALWFGRRS